MNIQNRKNMKNKRSNRSTNGKNTEFYIVYTVVFLLIALFLYLVGDAAILAAYCAHLFGRDVVCTLFL